MPHGRVTLRRLFAASIAWIAISTISGVAQEAASKPEAVALDKSIVEAATKDSEIMKNLAYLSDYIGPRLTGSESLRRANEWAAEVMKSYGLENVHQEGWTIPTGWERGTATARIVEPNNGRSLLIASRGWSPSTKGKVVGEVVLFEAKSSKDFDKYRGKLKNAIIMRGKPAEVRPITDLSAAATPSRARAAAAEKAALEQANQKKNDKSAPTDKGAVPSKLPTDPQGARPRRGAGRRRLRPESRFRQRGR